MDNTSPTPYLNDRNIEIFDPKYDPLFANLQGYVLKHHGREHAAHLFIRFSADKVSETRSFMREYAEKHITTTKKQLFEIDVYKRTGMSGSTFSTVFFTATGYTFFENLAETFSEVFRAGLQSRKEILHDPEINQWEPGFQNQIDCLIIVADDNPDDVATAVVALSEKLEEELNATICSIEFGHVIRNKNGDGIEHFGYVDGVSQPLFFKEESEKFEKIHRIKNGMPPLWDPVVRLGQVLVPDPACTENNAFGSYFVFRKLEQNVRGFKEEEGKLGNSIFGEGAPDVLKERAGAMVVGRFEDGTPLTLNKDDGMIGGGSYNNFNYETDGSGSRCPFHAHIRKVNPREKPVTTGNIPSDVDLDMERSKNRMIARRGIPFGHREVPPVLGPESLPLFPYGGVGLLFMCFQADIENQFEFMQRSANHSDKGIDVIIGQMNSEETFPPASYPSEYDHPSRTGTVEFKQFVHMKGGEYFFLPSMPFLRSL